MQQSEPTQLALSNPPGIPIPLQGIWDERRVKKRGSIPLFFTNPVIDLF
jgi:hypothetical protein